MRAPSTMSAVRRRCSSCLWWLPPRSSSVWESSSPSTAAGLGPQPTTFTSSKADPEPMNAAYLIVLFPLLGFGLLLCLGKRLGDPVAGWLATTAMGGGVGSAGVTFLVLLGQDAAQR